MQGVIAASSLRMINRSELYNQVCSAINFQDTEPLFLLQITTAGHEQLTFRNRFFTFTPLYNCAV